MIWIGVAFVIVFVAVAYVFLPTLQQSGNADVTADDRRDLEASKEMLVQELRELALDRDLGRIPADDARRRETRLKAELAGILRELDEGVKQPKENGV